jgi:hypothetical protein
MENAFIAGAEFAAASLPTVVGRDLYEKFLNWNHPLSWDGMDRLNPFRVEEIAAGEKARAKTQ